MIKKQDFDNYVQFVEDAREKLNETVKQYTQWVKDNADPHNNLQQGFIKSMPAFEKLIINGFERRV